MVVLACFISIIGLMAMDFINPSLPYIMQDFSASQTATKGMIIVYVLVLGVAQLFYGTFSDNYGRKYAIALSFTIVVIGSVLSALSPNLPALYIARIMTAFGTA